MLPCLSVVSDLAPVAGQPWPGHDHTRGVRGDTVSCVSPPCYKQLIFRCPPAPHFTVTLCQKIFGDLLLLLCLHGLSRPDTDKRLGCWWHSVSYLVLPLGAEVGLGKADLAVAAGVDLCSPPVPGPVPGHSIPQEPVVLSCVILSRWSPVVISVSVSAEVVLRLSECETQEQHEKRGLEKRGFWTEE